MALGRETLVGLSLPLQRLRGRLARFPEAGMLTAVVATALIFSLVDPRFASVRNVANIASQISFLAVLAVSMTYVIICGEIDLSISLVDKKLVNRTVEGNVSSINRHYHIVLDYVYTGHRQR